MIVRFWIIFDQLVRVCYTVLNFQFRGSSDLFYWKVYYKKKVYSVKKYIRSRQMFQKIIFSIS